MNCWDREQPALRRIAKTCKHKELCIYKEGKQIRWHFCVRCASSFVHKRGKLVLQKDQEPCPLLVRSVILGDC